MNVIHDYVLINTIKQPKSNLTAIIKGTSKQSKP